MIRARYTGILMMMVLAMAILAATGCSTLYKQTYYGVRGAEGKFYEVQVVDPAVLADYRSLQVETIANDLGAHLPAKVVTEVNQQTPVVLANEYLFYPTGKQLRVKGSIIHFTGKSGLDGSIGSVIGDVEECVCRIQLVDGESGTVVGEAVCWGMVKSAVRRGSTEIGKGVGKSIAKWIKDRLPKDVVEARRAELKPKEE